MLPETLGDPRDKGFSSKLGTAFRKRKDQIFETPRGQFQLSKSAYDSHNKVQKWKISFTAGSAEGAGTKKPNVNENFNNSSYFFPVLFEEEVGEILPAIPAPPAEFIPEDLDSLEDFMNKAEVSLLYNSGTQPALSVKPFSYTSQNSFNTGIQN